jgi:anti-anti-sigma factor
MSEITLEPTVSANEARLAIGGELDLASVGEAQAALALVQAPGLKRIVLDLRLLELIDSSGLRLLVDAERRARRQGQSLVIAAHPDGAVRKLLSIVLLSERIPVVDHPDDAAATPVPPAVPEAGGAAL